MKHLALRRLRPLIVGSLMCVVSGGIIIAHTLPAQAAPKPDKIAARDNVRWFYAWYVGQLNADKSPLDDRVKIAKFTSRRLNKWLYSPQFKDYGADYFLDAQDFDRDWTRATVNAVTIDGQSARAAATLGTPREQSTRIGLRPLKLKMVKESGAWKIDEVSAPEN